MNLRELYAGAIQESYESLGLLIEFLVLEKQVLTWESNSSELHFYYKPNNHKRMNELLLEHKEEIK